jgi:hypothetical protein
MILALALAVYGTLWVIPVALESMLLQKIVFFAFIALGFALALLFFFVNGGSSTLTEGVYEKEYYRGLKEGRAINGGTNNRWNPFKLDLCRRIYYSKLILAFLFPLILVFVLEYAATLLDGLFEGWGE